MSNTYYNYTTTNNKNQVKSNQNNFPPISHSINQRALLDKNLHSHAPNRCERSLDIIVDKKPVQEKISECGKKYVTKICVNEECVNCGVKYDANLKCHYLRVLYVVANFKCHHRLCPECAKKRARKWFHKLVKVKFRYPLFLTLTLRSGDDLEKLITVAINEFRAFCRRFKIKRGFRGIEIIKRENKDGKGEWFVHVHSLVDCLWLPGSEARAYWEKRTNAYQINFKRPYDKNVKAADIKTEYITIGAIKEVCKYVTKGIRNLKPEDLEEVDRAIRGRRLFSVFGIARSELALKLDTLETTLPKSNPNRCPVCGGKLVYAGKISKTELDIRKMFCKVVFLYDDS